MAGSSYAESPRTAGPPSAGPAPSRAERWPVSASFALSRAASACCREPTAALESARTRRNALVRGRVAEVDSPAATARERTFAIAV